MLYSRPIYKLEQNGKPNIQIYGSTGKDKKLRNELNSFNSLFYDLLPFFKNSNFDFFSVTLSTQCLVSGVSVLQYEVFISFGITFNDVRLNNINT